MTDPGFIEHVIGQPVAARDLMLDGTKIMHYPERVKAWQRGERIAPITMDVAWTL